MAVSESEMAAHLPPSISAQLEEDSNFFDLLVDMVPPGVYFPSSQTSASWKYQPTKALRIAAREESKERTKQSKRRKMDPSADRTSLTIQRQQHASKPDLAPPLNPKHSGDRAASYEQLRERLHHRLAQLRSQNGNQNGNQSGSAPKQPRVRPQLRAAEPDIPLSLEFGRLKTSADSEPNTKAGARAKRPKTGQLLAKAAALQDKLASVQKEEGEEGIAPYVWGKAAERAAGNKVLDDPKLLRQTMKKQQKKSQKSAKEWKSRVSAEGASRAAKQTKRQDALQHRADKKLKTKIARREKKLVRPGFEGRARGGATLGSKPATT